MGRYLSTDEVERLERWVKQLISLADECKNNPTRLMTPSGEQIHRLLGFIESAKLFIDKERYD